MAESCVGAQGPGRVRCASIFLDKNRRYTGTSQSKPAAIIWPHIAECSQAGLGRRSWSSAGSRRTRGLDKANDESNQKIRNAKTKLAKNKTPENEQKLADLIAAKKQHLEEPL